MPTTRGDQFFGYGETTWQAMVDAGYEFLRHRAQIGQPTNYSELAREIVAVAGGSIGPHDYAFNYILGDIGRRSFEERGVVLTGIVYYKDGGSELGPGFFGLAQELGLLPSGALGEDTKLRFQTQQTTAVLDAYRRG